MTAYYIEIGITPRASGFGEYQPAEASGDRYESLMDLLAASHDGIAASGGSGPWEVGHADCPPEIPDIRGRIHAEPGRLYGWLDAEGHPRYFGIIEIEA